MSAADGTPNAATPFAAPIPGRARKRAQALVGLSRDHHQALKQAMELKRTRQETAQSTWRRFAEFWERQGNTHFIEEECELLPAYARVADPSHQAVVRMLLEHVLIRAKVAAIREQPEPLAADFPLIEDATGMTPA